VRFNDGLIGVFLLLFAAAMMLHTLSFPAMPGQPVGPALFPVIIGIGMSIAGVILLVYGVLEYRREGVLVHVDEGLRRAHYLGNFLAVLVALVFYILAERTLGFIITAFVLSTALMIKLRRGHVLTSLLVAAAATVVVYVVFARFLRVPLPRGLLTGIVW
jgi:putative tricarboxylic transport membrane protein